MLSSDNPKYGYNAATGQYEDLMAAGIIDPTKVSCQWNYYFQPILLFSNKFESGRISLVLPDQRKLMLRSETSACLYVSEACLGIISIN